MKFIYSFVFTLFSFLYIGICPFFDCCGSEKETTVVDLKSDMKAMLGDYAVQHADKQTLEYLRKFVIDFYEGGKVLATDENKRKNAEEQENIQKEYANKCLRELDAYFRKAYSSNPVEELYLHQLALSRNSENSDFRYKVLGVFNSYIRIYHDFTSPLKNYYDLLKSFSDVPEPLLKLAAMKYISLWLQSAKKVNAEDAEKLFNTYKNDLPEYTFVQEALITGYQKRPSELFSVMAYAYLDKVKADEIIRKAETCKENPKILEDFAEAGEWWIQYFVCAAITSRNLPNEQELFCILEKSSVSGVVKWVKQTKGLRKQQERIFRSKKEQWMAFADLNENDIKLVYGAIQKPIDKKCRTSLLQQLPNDSKTPDQYKNFLFAVLNKIREPWLSVAAKGDDPRKFLEPFNPEQVSSQYGIVLDIKMNGGYSHFLRLWFPDNDPSKIGIKMQYGGENIYGPFILTLKDETERNELVQILQNIKQNFSHYGTIDDSARWLGNLNKGFFIGKYPKSGCTR